MDSASFLFVAFGLTIALLSNFSRSPVWRSAVLLVSSLGFLALLDRHPLSLLPLAAFLAAGYACLFLLKTRRSRQLAWILSAMVFFYIWLKKYTFLPEAIFLPTPYFTLGLSYIFFRVLHLLIETGEGSELPPIGPAQYLLYTLNFTTLMCGPIQRYDEFARDQFAADPIPLGPREIGLQMERIIRGFFKVNVLAVIFDILRQDALSEVFSALTASARLWAVFRVAVLYPLFLYCNFSGYIDVVIALARLMRVRLPENFDRPFAAASALEFWNRWHITLSSWLKSYVFNPMLLALMRRVSSITLQPLLAVFCFFVTFFLIGLWHGRTSEFLVFGLVTGGGISINKLWEIELAKRLGRKGYKRLAANPVYIAFGRGLNYSWFCFTLFWFWGSWGLIDRIFGAISSVEWAGVWLSVWLCATVILAGWEWVREGLLSIRISGSPVLLGRYARVVYASALGAAAFVMTMLLNAPAPAIVYRAF